MTLYTAYVHYAQFSDVVVFSKFSPGFCCLARQDSVLSKHTHLNTHVCVQSSSNDNSKITQNSNFTHRTVIIFLSSF